MSHLIKIKMFSSQITSLEPNLQKNLVASLELGLTSIGVDTVYTLCCDFLQVSIIRLNLADYSLLFVSAGAWLLHGEAEAARYPDL